MKMCLFRIFEVKKKDKLATYIVPNFKHGPINLYKKNTNNNKYYT